MSEKRYIKIKVRNLSRMIGEKDRSISVNDDNGKDFTIQDGAEVEVSEYIYNNLNDAVEQIYSMKKVDPEKPAKLIATNRPRFDITLLSDFYTKESKKETVVIPEMVEAMA